MCILPAVPHYQAALCSSSGGRPLWIPLLVSEATLHLLLVAAEYNIITYAGIITSRVTATISYHTVQATMHKFNDKHHTVVIIIIRTLIIFLLGCIRKVEK